MFILGLLNYIVLKTFHYQSYLSISGIRVSNFYPKKKVFPRLLILQSKGKQKTTYLDLEVLDSVKNINLQVFYYENGIF